MKPAWETGLPAYEAARRPEIHCVQPRTLAQTDMLLVHRIRERRVTERTTLINQLRGLLNEYGIVVAQGKEKLRAQLPGLLEDADNGERHVADQRRWN